MALLNHYLSVTTLCLTFLFAPFYVSANEKLNCSSEGEEYSHSLALEINHGKVAAFSYFSTFYAFSCDVSASRGDKDSKWSGTGKATKISFEDGNALITRSGNSYIIQFIDVSHMYHCGMRGQMADQIIITRGKKECEIR